MARPRKNVIVNQPGGNTTGGSKSLAIPFSQNDVERVREYYRLFEEAKSSLLTKDDYAEVEFKNKQGQITKSVFIKKTGWWKIKTLLNISVEILNSQRIKEGDKVVYVYKVQAKTLSGLTSQAEGVCSSDEPTKKNVSEFVLSGTAQTRAVNRAISMLVGGAELSAEEMEGVEVFNNSEVVEKRSAEIPSFKSGRGETLEKEKTTDEYDEFLDLDDNKEDLATERQISLLETFVRDGRLSSNVNIYSLSKQKASELISEVLRKK